MNNLFAEFLLIIGQMWTWAMVVLVPSSMSTINIIHVAIWTPVTLGLATMTGTAIRSTMPKQVYTFKITTGKKRARREVLLFLDQNPCSMQRHIRQNTSLGIGDVEEALKQLRKEGKIHRRWGGAIELTETGQEAANKGKHEIKEEERAQRAAQRVTERAISAHIQEEAKAQRAAERAVEQAQREEVKAQQVAQRAAEKAAAVEVARQAREEVKAQQAAQRAAEKAAAVEVARQAREEIKAQRAAGKAARPPRPRTPRAVPTIHRDPTTRAFGSDPSRVYEFRYRVVGLDELITSNTDLGTINPAYDPTLQPRQRSRAASQRQIEQAARKLVPEALLWDFRALDKGAPIVGDDLQVESGNGRALALRRARQAHPEQWANYQEALRGQLAAAGLSDSDLAGIESPVLVRERVTPVADRAAFAREANAPPVLQMSTLETAIVDSTRISATLAGSLAVREGQSIDQALRSRANEAFVRGFVGTLSENEAALLQRKDGTLAQAGIRRIKAALFVRTFEGESGERLAETFLEALDSDIKNFETGLSASLPVLARAENRIAAGDRAADLSIANDLSKALDMLSRLRESDTITVQEYVEQSTLAMIERETTPFQDELLLYFDEIGRSPKKIREFLESYAAAVEDAPPPSQVDLFGDSVSPNKEQLFERITKRKIAKFA